MFHGSPILKNFWNHICPAPKPQINIFCHITIFMIITVRQSIIFPAHKHGLKMTEWLLQYNTINNFYSAAIQLVKECQQNY